MKVSKGTILSIEVGKIERRKFPDGTDESEYEKCRTWSPRRWTWEFLARDMNFRKDCDDVSIGLKDKEEVAKKYRLKNFKYYFEKCKGESGTPKFSMGKISWLSNLDKKIEKRPIKTSVEAGQVLIRFDLNSASLDKRALTKQLKSAEMYLNKWLSEYSEKKPPVHSPYRDNFITYLRLLDMLATGKKSLDCAKILFPDMAKKLEAGELEKFELQDKVGWLIKSAKKMATETCRYLVLEQEEQVGK